MNMMRASLGTHCDHCHVIGEEWDFASDEKPRKKRARDMIQMVMDMNRTQFDGRSVISCYTCHRGSTRPMNLVPLPTPAPPFPTPVAEKVELPEAKTLIAKYAAAMGDTTRLGIAPSASARPRRRGTRYRSRSTSRTARFSRSRSLPKGQARADLRRHELLVARRAKGAANHAVSFAQENFSALAGAFAPVLPSDVGTESQTIRKEKVGERDTWVVQRGGPKEPYRRFFFDTEIRPRSCAACSTSRAPSAPSRSRPITRTTATSAARSIRSSSASRWSIPGRA